MNILSNNIKNIIIVMLLILFLAASATIYYLFKDKDKEANNLNTITGTIIVADSSYVIIETEEQDYLIKNIKGTYKLGDEVKFIYYESDLNKEDSLKTINKINDEELIKTSVIEENDKINTEFKDNLNISNNNDSTINQNNSSNNTNKNETSSDNNQIKQNSVSDKEINDNTSIEENSSADPQVLSYFNDLKNDIDSSNIKDNIKSSFITVVDFLFYNGKIKGYAFNELSNSAKLKVLAIALYFDKKIEEYYPGYKESISSSTSKVYTSIKAKIVTTYLNLTTTICTNNSELCSDAKEGFSDIKENFGLTWSLIKDIAGDGLDNLKNWYEIWSEK